VVSQTNKPYMSNAKWRRCLLALAATIPDHVAIGKFELEENSQRTEAVGIRMKTSPNSALQATCETHAPERRRYASLRAPHEP